jgi:Clp amino terminal domain, pathogenicity island component
MVVAFVTQPPEETGPSTIAPILNRLCGGEYRVPRANAADQAVLASALKLGHNYVGTEHILIACHRDPNSLLLISAHRHRLIATNGIPIDISEIRAHDALHVFGEQHIRWGQDHASVHHLEDSAALARADATDDGHLGTA